MRYVASARSIVVAAVFLQVAACAPIVRESSLPAPVWSETPRIPRSPVSVLSPTGLSAEEYVSVPDKAAAILGCNPLGSSPICAVAAPSVEEDSAFRAEGVRLSSHTDVRCRNLGAAIASNEGSVMMYRKALVRSSSIGRLYGVGHAYHLEDGWMVRVARRLDDLNERSLDDKTRTLRHEMSHTIGATETPGAGWTAEDYASNCA